MHIIKLLLNHHWCHQNALKKSGRQFPICKCLQNLHLSSTWRAFSDSKSLKRHVILSKLSLWYILNDYQCHLLDSSIREIIGKRALVLIFCAFEECSRISLRQFSLSECNIQKTDDKYWESAMIGTEHQTQTSTFLYLDIPE